MSKKFIETIYFNRDKENNWDIMDEAKELGFTNSRDLAYLGYEIAMEVEISEECNKVLKIEGIDVSDKEIYI